MTELIAFIAGGTLGIIGLAILMIGKNSDQDSKIAELRKKLADNHIDYRA